MTDTAREAFSTKESQHDVCELQREVYEDPVFEEEDGMCFPEELWDEFNRGKWCFGCTNCNCN